MERLDMFCHIMPAAYDEWLEKRAVQTPFLRARIRTIPAMADLDVRFRIMDKFEGYRQVVTLAMPPIEVLVPPEQSPELARVANDAMASLVQRYPDRFAGFAAALPMNNPDAALKEAQRAVEQLGASGIQVHTNVNGQPLDRPEFISLFELMARYDRPVWVHPSRQPSFPDYRSEDRSRYDIWWAFGWPYETAAFMTRMVFSGIFDRCPNLKFITHHMGGLVPYLEGRLGWGMDKVGIRTGFADDQEAKERLRKRPYDYFRMFYADTALFGALAATECGVAFFGSERVLFGTDFPFGPDGGELLVRETIRVVENITVSPEVREQIFYGNARRLLGVRQSAGS